jgi:hypothetical protein
MVLWLKSSICDRGLIKITETDLANESKTSKIDFKQEGWQSG